MKEFIFILACVFCIFQCEDQTITETRTETETGTDTITETRILQFHEIEAPEEVSVSSKSFEITLKNTCDVQDDHAHHDEHCHIDSIYCDESFSWGAGRKNNYLQLTPEALHSYEPGDVHCSSLGAPLKAISYQVQGPFEIGSFHIIVRGSQTLEKVVKIVE